MVGMIIYRPTDRIPVKIGPLTLSIKPLTSEESIEVNSIARNSGGELQRYSDMSLKALEIAICDVKGLEGATYPDGTPVELEKAGSRYSKSAIEIVVSAIGNSSAQSLSGHIIGGNNPALAAMVEVKDSTDSKKKP